jgi:hypothetical protein
MWGECGGAGTRVTKTAQAAAQRTHHCTRRTASARPNAPREWGEETFYGCGSMTRGWLHQRGVTARRRAVPGAARNRPTTGLLLGALREGLYNTEKWRPARINKRHVRRGRRSKRSCVCLEQLALLARRLGLGARAGLEAKARGEGRGEKCSGAGCTREARRRPKPGREGVRPLHGRLH